MPQDNLSRYAQHPLRFLGSYIARRPLAHAVILLAVIAAVACSVGTQYGVKVLVDALSVRGPVRLAPWHAFGLVVALVAADNLLWRVASWTASYTFVYVTGDLRADLFRHLTGHAPSYFAERQAGVLTSRVTATSNAVFQIENMFVWNVFPPCAATVFSIALLASVNLAMAGALVLIAAIVIVVMFRIAAAGRPLHHAFADKAATVDGEMIDVVGNMALVKTFGGLRREHRRFDATVGEEMQARKRSLLYLEKLRLLHAVTVVVMTMALLAWAIVLWRDGRISPGDVVMVCTLGIAVLSATRDLAVALVDVTQHLARFSEAVGTLLTPHERHEHPQARDLRPAGLRITYEDVWFAYPRAEPVFRGLSVQIPAGQRVGLVGQSGSGKSTFAALLQRFYAVQRGRILLDGQPLSHITEDSLRQAIGVVPQDTALLNRSLLENIRYGNPDAPLEAVRQAAAQAGCLDFIEALPQGLQTRVGDRGMKLSGGQRQRIAIARAFLKNAPLLILDEATSALDSDTEESIRQALDRLMAGRTVIAIAHRLSTLRNFDRILVFAHGRIVEDGTPDALLARRGAYYELVQRELERLAHGAGAAPASGRALDAAR
ncbi:ABC transporter ATP-binding protein [Orrella sp. JC864]|uniref:ABC transporter ATP-binding protein n=1 Tax=Orrella sp. JC864 TaxID=3120298 RepID=UPI0030097CBC